MTKTVYFYTDNPGHDLPESEWRSILQFFRADTVEFLHSKQTHGFVSGVEWDKISNPRVIILFDTNDACICGIREELADLLLGDMLQLFEYSHSMLHLIDNFVFIGRKHIATFPSPELALQS